MPKKTQYAVLSVVAIAYIALALIIARVFDSPTSTFLLVGMVFAALGGTFLYTRQQRRD